MSKDGRLLRSRNANNSVGYQFQLVVSPSIHPSIQAEPFSLKDGCWPAQLLELGSKEENHIE